MLCAIASVVFRQLRWYWRVLPIGLRWAVTRCVRELFQADGHSVARWCELMDVDGRRMRACIGFGHSQHIPQAPNALPAVD